MNSLDIIIIFLCGIIFVLICLLLKKKADSIILDSTKGEGLSVKKPTPEKPPEPPAIIITESFKQAGQLVKNKHPLIFISGGAGTGKSTLIGWLRTQFQTICLAPTGVAALNIKGSTIHRFFKLPPRIIQASDIKPFRDKELKLIQRVERIIIDEISMVRSDILDGIDLSLRINRHSDQPFGGVQMILVGDILQLPPVVTREEKIFFMSEIVEGMDSRHVKWDSPWFFDSNIFKQMSSQLQYIELKESFRQKEQSFVSHLNAVRTKASTYIDSIAHFNQNVRTHDVNSVFLTSTNVEADETNSHELMKLPGNPAIFPGVVLDKNGRHVEFTEKEFNDKCPAPYSLELKLGARVMFLVNAPDLCYVNGTTGNVLNLTAEGITVRTDYGQICNVQKTNWPVISYDYDVVQDKIIPVVVRQYIQFPLRLAWAFTIHKSQGKTLNKVHVKMDRGAFASGQAYVALSRCREFTDLSLAQPLTVSDIKIDIRAINFLNSLTT